MEKQDLENLGKLTESVLLKEYLESSNEKMIYEIGAITGVKKPELWKQFDNYDLELILRKLHGRR